MTRQKRKRKLKVKRFITFLLMITVVAFAFKYAGALMSNNLAEKKDIAKAVVPPITIKSDLSPTLNSSSLHSLYAILIDMEDDTILMQKRSEEKIYPASLTKIMTVIVAIENLSDMQKEITLSSSMFHALFEADAAIAGFRPGENVKAIDLIYGALLPSGAECCIGLAEHIAGSETDFVKIMNKKASELGMDNTHFENSTGLHSENHYTSVKDMAVLLKYALENSAFRDVFTSKRYSTAQTNKHPEGITFYSTMFKDLKTPEIIGGRILGGKTGYTGEAGQCLASLAQKEGREYILVTAGAKGDNRAEHFNIDDAYTVYNGF